MICGTIRDPTRQTTTHHKVTQKEVETDSCLLEPTLDRASSIPSVLLKSSSHIANSQQYTSLRSPAKDTGEYHESRRPWSPYSRLPPHYDYPERRNHPLSPYHTSSASRSYPALQDSPKGLLHEYNNNTPLSRYTVKDDLPNQSTHVKRYTENDSSTCRFSFLKSRT